MEIKRSSDQLNLAQNDGDDTFNHCIIVETNKKCNLEEKYGSFSISFA
jgi:hypothetical protein